MGRAGPRSSPPPGPQPPSPSIASLGKYLLPPPGRAAAGCFLFLPSCKLGGDTPPGPLGAPGVPGLPAHFPLVLELRGLLPAPPCPALLPSPPSSVSSSLLSPLLPPFMVCLPHLLQLSPPWTQPPGASAHLLLSPSTAQEVLGLQGHPSQGPDEAAGHWGGPQG